MSPQAVIYLIFTAASLATNTYFIVYALARIYAQSTALKSNTLTIDPSIRFIQLRTRDIKNNQTKHRKPISVTNLIKEVDHIAAWTDDFSGRN